MNQVTHPLNSADISNFFTRNKTILKYQKKKKKKKKEKI